MFCGSLTLGDICYLNDINNFDFNKFIFAASYFMVNDSYTVSLLKTAASVTFKTNNILLPTLYIFLTLNIILPRTLALFESKFPDYNKSFVESINNLPYSMFRKRFLKSIRHNECYKSHFYHDVIGRAHCSHQCDICE